MEVMPQSLALRDFPLPKSCVQMEYGAREAPQPQKGVALVFAYPMITAKPDAISHARYGALIEDALAIWSALVRKMAFFCSGCGGEHHTAKALGELSKTTRSAQFLVGL